MKKFLLSIFAVMLAVFSVQADTKTYTYDFSKNTNWVTTKGGSTAVATGSSNTLNDFYDKATGDVFNAGGKGYFPSTNAGYFLWGKSGAYIELPTYAGEKITNVTAKSSSGHSTSVTVGIYSGSTSVVSAKTWSTNSSLYSYDIPAEYQSEVLRLQVTNGKNSQVVSITITTETTGEGSGEVEPETPVATLPTVSEEKDAKIALGTEITITPAAGNTVQYAIDDSDEFIEITEAEEIIVADYAGVMSLHIVSTCGEESVNDEWVFYVMPNKPVISAADDTFEESLEVSIEAEDGDIYYTLDGNDPTEESTLYESAFTITETTTVKAIAVVDGVASIVASATYKYVDPNLVISNSTISFANTTQRVSQNTTQQVWSNGTINFTNNKSASQSNIVDSSNPVKCYASSSITLECVSGNITEILFDCNSSSYATALKNSFGNTVISTVSGKKVTVTLDGTSNTFTIEKLSAQVRLDAVTVTYATEGETLSAPILPASTTFDGSYEVEITAGDGVAIYYTLDGNEPTKESTLYEGPFTITETTTVKAIAVKNELVSTAAVATYKLVKTLNNCTVAELIEAYASGDDIAEGATVVGYIVGAANGSLDKAEFGTATIDTNILLADDPYETNVENCIPVQLPSDVRTALNLKDNSNNYQKKVILTGDVQAYFSVAGLKNTSAYEFVEMFYNTITVSDAGWATLYLPTTARIPSNVEAYTVTAVNDGWVSLTPVTGVIPANTGIIVKANAGEYKLIVSETATTDVTGNLLSGSAYNKDIYEEAYVLGKVDGVVGLYKAEMTEGVWLNNAFKAYLPASALTPAQQTAAFYGFDWNGTTGIDQITDNREQSTVIYDLTGRRVETITEPGIYIVGGKKVLVK